MQNSSAFDAAVLEAPLLIDHPRLRIAGPRLRRLANPAVEIPPLWQRFAPFIGRVPRQMPGATFGLCMQGDGGTDYVAGCEVADFSRVAADWSRIEIPAQRYAVFRHRGNATQLGETVQAIFGGWLPQSGCTAVPAGPDRVGFFERYGPGFDPQAGRGDIELWLPIAA
jgi:AraC family transcriptional regulator